MIHLQTMFKVDVFVVKQRPFDRVQMERRQRVAISQEPERFAYIATAEDNILAKLEWYRLGNEASERQWRDVQNVIKTQAERLDVAYMRQWAATLGLENLLGRALDEASATSPPPRTQAPQPLRPLTSKATIASRWAKPNLTCRPVKTRCSTSRTV